MSVPPTSNIHIRHCFCDSTGVFLLWQNIFFPNPSHEPRKNKSSEMAKVSFSRSYLWGNLCRFLVFEFLKMTKFVISNVKNYKIETMQFQIFWQHKKVPFWFAAFAIFMSQKDSCSPEVFLVGKKKSLLFHMIYSDNTNCAIFESDIDTELCWGFIEYKLIQFYFYFIFWKN